MHEVLINRLGGLSLPRKSVVRLTDRPDMTLDVYRGRKTTKQHKQQLFSYRLQLADDFMCPSLTNHFSFSSFSLAVSVTTVREAVIMLSIVMSSSLRPMSGANVLIFIALNMPETSEFLNVTDT